MNRLLVYILVPFLVLSCNEIDKPKKPDNLLSKDKMIEIITDISLVNAAKGVDKKLIEEKIINPEYYIFQKYNIDSLQFAENNNYYAYDVKEYEDIYLNVKNRLEKHRDEYDAIEELEKKGKDSIRDVKRKEKDSIRKARSQKNAIKSPKLQRELLQETKPANLSKKDRKLQQ